MDNLALKARIHRIRDRLGSAPPEPMRLPPRQDVTNVIESLPISSVESAVSTDELPADLVEAASEVPPIPETPPPAEPAAENDDFQPVLSLENRLSQLGARVEKFHQSVDQLERSLGPIPLAAPKLFQPDAPTSTVRPLEQLSSLAEMIDACLKADALIGSACATLLERARALIIVVSSSAETTPGRETAVGEVQRLALAALDAANASLRREQTREGQRQQLQAFHADLRAGRRPPLSALDDLILQICEDLDFRGHLELNLVERKDPHEIVAQHSLATAAVVAFMGSLRADWRALRTESVRAALVADVGMLGVSDFLWQQADPLTEQQQIEIERHPLVSASYLQQSPDADPGLLQAVRQHHERPNGAGYPEALDKSQMSRLANWLAVANSYAAQRQSRPHRPARSAKQALFEILEDAELGRLDGEFARALLNLSICDAGAWVELSTGEHAQVLTAQRAEQEPSLVSRPVVRVLLNDPDSQSPRFVYWNLALRTDCRIVRTLSADELSPILQRVACEQLLAAA